MMYTTPYQKDLRLRWYNEERIHLSFGGITPKEKADQIIHTITP